MDTKYTLALLVCTLTLGLSGYAQAQTEARPAPTTQNETRPQLSERANERVINLAANISNKMDAAAIRLQNIIGRLDSRINKLEAAGIDVAAARLTLNSAQVSLTTAVNSLATIDATVLAAIGSQNPQATWADARDTFQTIRINLLTARTDIRATIEALQTSARTTDTTRAAAATATAPILSDTENAATETPITE